MKAVGRLIASDKKRGLKTRIVSIDSPEDMKTFHGRPVAARNNRKSVKAAIDAVYNACQPDYLLILGAPDIIPHQELENPAYGPGGDEDTVVPTDIPYACDTGYSTDPCKFVGPTRVVGRLPDLTGVSDASYLISLLDAAARHRTRHRSDYLKYFSVTADVWKGSTALSLTNLFGESRAMATSPPKGPAWTRAQLAPRIHFINCHGAQSDPHFYGQRGSSYPVAHSAGRLDNNIMNGTVVAVECCYGAELYDPSDSDMQAGICSAYLGNGAYGYFGSSTIAYGPSEGNGQADLICRYFLEEAIKGSSLGEAALRARHRFASAYTHLDPTDLKTLVQFNLLADPSIRPVAPASHALTRTRSYKQIFRLGGQVKGTRMLRREKNVRTGANLADTLGTVKTADEKAPDKVASWLKAAARESGVRTFSTKTFSVDFPDKGENGHMKRFEKAREGRMIYMLTGTIDIPVGAPGRIVALVATVQDGEIIHMRRLHSR